MVNRIAVIKKDKCNPIACGDLCMKLCPLNRMGENCIMKGTDTKPIIDEIVCNGCGICANRCPTDAISIIKLPGELDSEPIHKYGQNGFHLFNLPTPVFGKVVGILGKNGIGKSTAIQVLSGMIQPNLGKEESTYDDLIQYFKGSETQKYFERLKTGQIKVAFKPQHVEMIAKSFDGTVKELLEKVDEKGELQQMSEVFELTQVLDRKISQVSGGELQRIAIAATVLKKANVYIFDEPTSYLDINQRMKISEFIQSLATPEVAVVVIEHDLILLDHMTDNIHLMYGKEGVYGIVSGPKTTRVGINAYLQGYLKEENIRFRDKEIKFEVRPPTFSQREIPFVTWQNLNKKLGTFELNIEEGCINNNQLIGILGQNGIGKTTFVKMIAGILETDSGKVDQKVKVAYKPQYLEPSDDLVMNVLARAIEQYENQLIGPLNLTPLFEKQLDQLSGGELQRVAVAVCLSEDAELYLLDEPSAYLDVEQRLLISKVVRQMMDIKDASCLVVDHDLLFVDYLSQKLVVFDGVPSISGKSNGPYEMADGMNKFLEMINITLRRDSESNRPRINKLDSQLDRDQRSKNNWYYSG